MNIADALLNRRRFLGRSMALGLGGGAFSVRGVFPDELIATPRLTEGPFYPDKLPLDTDNDLLILNDSITPAVGQITHLTGKILGPTGQALRNAIIEIWQVDANGAYIHSADSSSGRNDKNFQGYGRFLTDSKGQYYFRTIKPISYTLIGIFRTAHIHFAISKNGKRVFTTQMLVKGLPDNARDTVVRGIN